MTKANERGVPVRADLWRPDDELLNSIIQKCIDEAYQRSPGEGSPVLVSGGLVLSTLAVIVAVGTGNALLAAGIVIALGVAGIGFIAMRSAPAVIDRTQVLGVTGGPGNLPAGYLVHPPAWEAGMEEYVSTVSDRHLRVAVRLCREYPGAVSSLLRLVRRAEKQVEANGKELTEAEVFKIASRMVSEQAAYSPTLALSR
ncbi:hypothetical protein [Actinoplanes sp. GCM10030250]|uniref:hypothetical protein n=1 Tax=Actinoplanes sp. GCM10030250 TaxID=3273376 RepID=UPI0036207FBC